MSDFAGGNLAIKNYIRANFTVLPEGRQAFANEPFTGNVTESHVRWSVASLTTSRVTIGSGGEDDIRREEGAVVCRIFTPPDAGEEEAMTLAVDVADLLRDQTLDVPGNSGAVRLFTPGAPIRLGNNDQGFYEVSISTPYRRDERL